MVNAQLRLTTAPSTVPEKLTSYVVLALSVVSGTMAATCESVWESVALDSRRVASCAPLRGRMVKLLTVILPVMSECTLTG